MKRTIAKTLGILAGVVLVVIGITIYSPTSLGAEPETVAALVEECPITTEYGTLSEEQPVVPEIIIIETEEVEEEEEEVEIRYDYISNNRHLTDAEMQMNARCIYHYLSNYGWSDNAIFALLGNAEYESTINPGRWQSGKGPGYGIVQWTPGKKKIIKWANTQGEDAGDMLVQLDYLEYLALNGEGWCGKYSMSFYDFTRDETHDVEYLTDVFLHNYERPKSYKSASTRKKNACKWAEYFSEEG